MREHGIGKAWNVVGPQYTFLAKGIFQSTIHNVTFGKSTMADVDMFTSEFWLPTWRLTFESWSPAL